jgi:recombination protein RecA
MKNKVAPPFREAEFDIIYGEGISRTSELVDTGLKLGLIEKGGSWFTYRDQRLQGKDSMKDYLKQNPEIADELEEQIKERLLSGSRSDAPAEEAPAAAGRAVSISADDFED